MNKEISRFMIVKAYKSGFRRIVTGGDMTHEQAEQIAEKVRFNPNIVCVEIYTCKQSFEPYLCKKDYYDYE